MNAERLAALKNVTLWQVRAFLYHTVHAFELFIGDGYVHNMRNEATMCEYVTHNRLVDDLGEYRHININISLFELLLSGNINSA